METLGLETEPDFEAVSLDAPLIVRSRSREIPGANGDGTFEEPPNCEEATLVTPISATRQVDPTLRVQILQAANLYPDVVHPDDPLMRATTIMLSKDFSQLPIVANHKLLGSISWRSIGRRLIIGDAKRVSDCLEPALEIRPDLPLLEAIEQITRSDCAFIVSISRRLQGLVTTADLSREFRTLSEPFLLLREAENYIRNMLTARFNLEELRKFRDPLIPREVSSVADLTMGEYLRALEQDDTWTRLQLPVDRNFFLATLKEVQQLRNDVMHFDPDPIEDARLLLLAQFIRLLQAIGKEYYQFTAMVKI